MKSSGKKESMTIAMCSAGELFGGVEQWICTFAGQVQSSGCGVQGSCHSEADRPKNPGYSNQENNYPRSFVALRAPQDDTNESGLRMTADNDVPQDDTLNTDRLTQNPEPSTQNLDFIIILFWDGELARRLRAIGVEPIIVKTKGTYDLGVFKRLRQVFQEHNVGVVHTHGFKADVLCGIAAMQCGIPRVKTQHGAVESKDAFSIPSLRMRLNIVLSRLVEPFFDRIIFVTKDLLQKRFIKSKKMTVIHNAIPAIPDGEKRTLDPKEVFKIGIIGRICRVKGHKYLIKALAGLPTQCHVYVFGEGSLKGELLQYAHQCGVLERLHFMGFQRDIHAYMRALDIFAMPSLHEGLPYTLLDAMYLRVPVVASRVGGLAEVLREAKDALLVEPKDADALKNALLHFYNDRDFARHVAANAYEKVTKEFMIDNMVNKYLKEYNECHPEGVRSTTEGSGE